MKNEPTSTNKNHKILKAVPMILAFSVLGIGIFTLAEGGKEAKGYRGGNREIASTTVTASDTTTDKQTLTEGSSLVGYGSKGALADSDLSLEDMLAYAIQDEYTARGEYEAIISTFGSLAPYTNIIKSETSHISSLTTLYETYGLIAPADDSKSHLVIPESLLAAAQTGVQAEIDNIAMYEKFLSTDLPDDVRQVFESLKDASYNHLAAFEKQVSKLGK